MKTCKELEEFLNEDTCLGVINVYDETLDEMARVGKIPDSQLEIHIEGAEGNIPHFHLQRKNGRPENCICHIKLLEPEYLRDKNDPMNTLSSKERKALNDYMHKHIALSESTNWKYCIDTWNIWNSGHPVDATKYQCPDYTKLK